MKMRYLNLATYQTDKYQHANGDSRIRVFKGRI